MKKMTAAVAGAGFVGVAHVEALRRLGNVEVVALCDVNNARAKAGEMNVPAFYDDFKKMIDEKKPDCVHVCTPDFLHKEMSVYAMEKGVNVICEKPLTATLEEAEEMVKTAEKTGVVNAVNFHNRFNPLIHQLKQMAARGELGKIFTVHGGYLQDFLLYQTDTNWRINQSNSGKMRVMVDIGSHWLDTVQYVTGLKITEVMADFSIIYPVRKKAEGYVETFAKADPNAKYTDVPVTGEDTANVLLRFDNGAKGNAIFSQMFAGKKNKITFFFGGTKKSAEWDSENALNEAVIGNRDGFNMVIQKDPGQLDPQTRPMVSFPGGHAEGFPDTFKQLFKEVYARIADKNSARRNFAVFKDGLEQMLIGEKIFESARSGKWVKIR